MSKQESLDGLIWGRKVPLMKKTISILVVLVILAGAYFILKSDSQENNTSSPEAPATASEETPEVVVDETKPLLNQMTDAEAKLIEEVLGMPIDDVPEDQMKKAEEAIILAFKTTDDVVVENRLPPESMIPPVVQTASFVNADLLHRGEGNVNLYQDDQGYTVIRFEDVSFTKGPDLFVYLTNSPDKVTKFDLQVGQLKGNKGDQNYTVKPVDGAPADYKYVMVWCRAFDVVFATAELQPVEDLQ